MHVSTNASITCWGNTEISRKIGQCMLAKLQKRLLASSYSVYLSVWKNSAATEWVFMKSVIWVFFGNLLRKFKSHEKLTRIPGSLHEYQYTFLLSYLAQFFLQWEMFQTTVIEKIKTHFNDQQFFFSKIVPFMRCGKILYSWADNRCILSYPACALHAGYLRLQKLSQNMQAYCFSTATMVTRTHLSVTSHVHCLSCYIGQDN